MWRIRLMRVMSESRVVSHRTRMAALRAAGIVMGPNVRILRGTRFVDFQTRLGEDSFISRGCYFEDHAPIIIGDRTWIGARCAFLTATHDIGTHDRRAGDWRTAPITIGNGCWIGAAVTVLPGVTIGDGCVIAAGAVVTTDCEDDALYTGIPAALKRRLADV